MSGDVDVIPRAEPMDVQSLYTPAQLGRLSPRQVWGIERRVLYGDLPRWRRWTTRPPEGWRH